MSTQYPYRSKTEQYARYRWSYAADTIQALFDVCGIGATSFVADIGAGTGILTSQLIDKVQTVYAVEPDPEMRAWLLRSCGGSSTLRVIDGSAEATTLPAGSVDMIAVAQALHWFDAFQAKQEFRRILRSDGWLAVIWNQPTSGALTARLSSLYNAEYGWDTTEPAAGVTPIAPESYFQRDSLLSYEFPVTVRESWEHFIGGLYSDSHAPLESHPAFPRFVHAARSVFDNLAVMGSIEVTYVTHLLLGRLTGITSG